jgi:enoyl-[acyl-carrier protein] reductase I
MARTIDLSGSHALVMGVANHRSLAWAIAESLGTAGCRLILTYQGERLREKVAPLAAKYDGTRLVPCDVSSDEEMDALFDALEREPGALHALVHSIAFAPREALEGEFLATTREAWRTALDISAYSLVALARRSAELLSRGRGSVIALTYMASQRVVPSYNVMGSAKAALEHAVRQLAFELGPRGVRVNAISAGPVQTLSARGVSGFVDMLAHNREIAPLRRTIEPREVGDAALFLCSELGSGVTGATLYVDAGYHILAP